MILEVLSNLNDTMILYLTCFCLVFTVFSKQKWELQWMHLKNVRYLGNKENYF